MFTVTTTQISQMTIGLGQNISRCKIADAQITIMIFS